MSSMAFSSQSVPYGGAGHSQDPKSAQEPLGRLLENSRIMDESATIILRNTTLLLEIVGVLGQPQQNPAHQARLLNHSIHQIRLSVGNLFSNAKKLHQGAQLPDPPFVQSCGQLFQLVPLGSAPPPPTSVRPPTSAPTPASNRTSTARPAPANLTVNAGNEPIASFVARNTTPNTKDGLKAAFPHLDSGSAVSAERCRETVENLLDALAEWHEMRQDRYRPNDEKLISLANAYALRVEAIIEYLNLRPDQSPRVSPSRIPTISEENARLQGELKRCLHCQAIIRFLQQPAKPAQETQQPEPSYATPVQT